jgi:hypothetical protein
MLHPALEIDTVGPEIHIAAGREVAPAPAIMLARPRVNGGAKRDRCGGVRRDHLASVSLSP